ncbi:spermidine synthase [Nitrosopumilus sp.]|uniref:spermidine synthase n=1 Tax=Nitrosopumilus sp. TaxID=2024843 RepID=UPI0026381C31|nr:fused MFS/spermidine synthase [Nitrosopumilus sp.]
MKRNIIILLLGLSGVTALFYEIIWIRPLSLVFGTTVYAVSTIIASFILGLAIGSWLAGKYSHKISNPLKFFAFVQIGIGTYGVLLLPVFSSLPPIYLAIYQAVLPNQILFFIVQILLSILLISIPAILMGTTLPIMIKAYAKKFESIGYDVGKLDAANSIGAVIGTLVVGFILIPFLGIQASLIITALINLGMGTIIIGTNRFIKFRCLSAIAVILVPFFIIFPTYDVEPLTLPLYQILNEGKMSVNSYQHMIDNQQLLHYDESAYSTITVIETDLKRLHINGKSQCAIGPMGIFRDGVNLAKLPSELYYHNFKTFPKTALNVGLGCGDTSQWFAIHGIDVTTLEIDPAVIEVNEKFSPKYIDHNLVIDDGRNWLLRTNQTFDVITGQPYEPYDSHSSLFTKEYFELQKLRLSENGISSQWVPMYTMTMDDFFIFYNTYNSVFPHVHIYNNLDSTVDSLLFIGSKQPILPIYDKYYIGSDYDIEPRKTELNTDDKTVLETNTALNLYTPDRERITEKEFLVELFSPSSENS